MEEFSNGATQVTVYLKNQLIFKQVLVSQSKYIIAIRGHSDLPFEISEISDIYQLPDDKDPAIRGKWDFWDKW